jgi:hypothetical protein
MMARLRVGRLTEVEDRALSGEPVRLLALAPRERLLEHLEHPETRVAGRVQRAALDERLERALVARRRVDTFAEVPDRRERPVLLAGADDPARRRLPHVLHG